MFFKLLNIDDMSRVKLKILFPNPIHQLIKTNTRCWVELKRVLMFIRYWVVGLDRKLNNQ